MSTKEKLSFKKTGHAKSATDGQGWRSTEVNDTLNSFDNAETRTPTLILQKVYENHSQDTRYRDMGEVCQPISATFGMGGNNQPFVVKQVFDASRRHNYQQFEDDVCETVQAHYGTGGGNVPMVMEESMESIVRRLTPMECERLQGYPDGWTDIGEWIDSKGKKHKDADSPRYKALGNSIALPFWEWMAERMVKQLKESGIDHPTMASLFDGIGGFPLVFSRCGTTPVWASEIEEFPIAVTKKRFPDLEDEIHDEHNIDK